MTTGSRSDLERFRRIAIALDSRFTLPLVPVRIGYDAIIGLIPGVGDIAGGIIASYGLLAGFRLGAPVSVLLRMLGNIALDTVIGAIPIAGDLFDIGWKGNLRNLALLDRWMDDPRKVERRSVALIWGIGVGVLLLFASMVYMIFAAMSLLVRR